MAGDGIRSVQGYRLVILYKFNILIISILQYGIIGGLDGRIGVRVHEVGGLWDCRMVGWDEWCTGT